MRLTVSVHVNDEVPCERDESRDENEDSSANFVEDELAQQRSDGN